MKWTDHSTDRIHGRPALPDSAARVTAPAALGAKARRIAFALLAGAFLFGPPAAAADKTEANPDSALSVTLAKIEGAPLALESAVQSALENSTEARDAQAEFAGARAAVLREKGAFDPELFGIAQRTSNDQRTASPFSGANVLNTDLTTGSAGARIHLRSGADIEASLDAMRTETNSAYASLKPQYDATGTIRVEQPLLKGFGPSAKRGLASAERQLNAARVRNEDATLGVRASVEGTYWSLYAAERDFAVEQLIRDRAKALLEQARLRAKAGLVGPNEVANARVFLAEQEQAALDREEELDRTSDALATLMGQRPAAGSPRFRTTDEPPRTFEPPPQDALVDLAIKENGQIRAAAFTVDAARALERGARWDAFPQLNLFGSLGGTGLSGSGQDVVFGPDTLRTTVSGGFGSAWNQVVHRDYPNWSAGLLLSIPLGLRSGRGARDELRAQVSLAEQRKVAVERSIEESVRANHRELVNGSRRLEVAREGLDAAFEQVRIGMIEYKNGKTTAFELVRLGADLATAQQRYSQALVRAAKAAAELRYLTAGAYPASGDEEKK